ncbi:MAG: hypothetical protein NTZ33_07630 [Bacteroidetes bacterium]|nr:hypothetical protein [Bacteroidota bacterium]
MSKKSLDRKATQKFIKENREIGKSDQEIYYELTEQYYDKKSVALLITATATKEDKAKYNIYNNILLVILVIVIMLKVLSVFSLTLETGTPWTLLLVFIVPLFAGYFAYEIARYNAPVYRFCGIMTIVGFVQSIGKSVNITDILLNIFFTAAIVGLSFFLDYYLFPNYSPSNLKQDSNGEYIFN